MSGIKIIGMGHSVPKKVLTNQDLEAMVETSDEWIRTRTGIRERRICRGETHADLCVRSAQQALACAQVQPEEIGAVIVCTLSADYLTPSAACLVQRRLHLPEDTLSFDLNAACSGFLYGLHTMECLLAACPRKFGLVIGAEALSHLVDYQDRSTCVLFGDGAGAAVVQYRPEWPSIHAVLGARGDAGPLSIPGAGRGLPNTVSMDGQAVFRFAVETLPKCIDAVLSAAGLTPEDPDCYVFHQANARIIDLAARRYNLPPEKVAKNIDRYGNTSAASIPLLLSELWQAGTIGPGSRVLCVGFGGGLTWGGALVELGVRTNETAQ